MSFRGVINGKADKHLPYPNFETSHVLKFLLGKQSFYKIFSDNSYDWLKFLIFAWLDLNPDFAPEPTLCTDLIFSNGFGTYPLSICT